MVDLGMPSGPLDYIMVDGKPISVSWSKLKKFEFCHAYEHLSSQGKAKQVIDGRIFLPGTIADRIMRVWLDSDNPQPGQMVDMIDEMFRRYADPETDEERAEAQYVIKWKGNQAKDRDNVKKFVHEVITELEPILAHWVIPYDYEPELRFKTTIGVPYLDGRTTGVILNGGIDIATRYEAASDEHPAGRFRLFDLKATKNKGYINTTVGQSTFYQLAFGHYIGDREQPDTDFGFISPALETKIHWSHVTEEDQRAMMSRIINYCHAQWKADWNPKADDDGCAYCTTRHVCPKFALQIDKDAHGKHRASFEKQAANRRMYKQEDKDE